MCGIVGIVGKLNACKSALNVLKNLEYRGYDSAGLAFLNKNNLSTIKALGKLHELKAKFEILEEEIKDVSIAIGHTRWATHGKVILENTKHLLDTSQTTLLYIGTDERNLSFFDPFREHFVVKTLNDYMIEARIDEENANHIEVENVENLKNDHALNENV